MADFINGLRNAHDYINNTHIDIPNTITADLGTGSITADTSSFTVKELACAILGGNGIKLPNIQMCLHFNLSNLIPAIPAALGALNDALDLALGALDSFITHTGIDEVLGRINGAIAEIASIANMINFCGTPISPAPIPNVLRDMLGSFAGEGKSILDKLGKMADSDIGGCIGTGRAIGGIPNNLFIGGAIKDVIDLINDYNNGAVEDLQERIDSINFQLEDFTTSMNSLIEHEENYTQFLTTNEPHASGGSIISPKERINTEVGSKIPTNITVQQAMTISAGLQSTYNQLSQYVIDSSGKNIFDYLLEPELIAKLEENVEASPVITEQQPVYDYCGKIIGFTTTVVSGNTATSSGAPLDGLTLPGSFPIENTTDNTIAELQSQIAELTARLDALTGSN